MIPKFRAWHKENGEMIDVGEVDFNLQSIYYANGNISFDEFDIMQSTNLFDKNGVEIFEGDILAWEQVHTRKTDWVGLVERVNATFAVWTSDNARTSGSWLNVATESVEVIGNRHEHYYLIPEILGD